MRPVDNMFRPGCSLNGANGRVFFRGKDMGYPDDVRDPAGNTQWSYNPKPHGQRVGWYPSLTPDEQRAFSHFDEAVGSLPHQTGIGQHPLDADHVKIVLYYGGMPPSTYLP